MKKFSDNNNMRNLVSITSVILLSVFFVINAAAQSDIVIENTDAVDNEAAAQTDFEPLPSGYSGIELGMPVETVKNMLFDSPNFSYRGEPDVSMSPVKKQTVIDCDGVLYIDRGHFQFHDDGLYLITMVMDPEYIDHFSIYTKLRGKYGEPVSLDPERTVWDDGKIRISLERPLSLKYIDLEVFRRLQEESSSDKSMEALLRQDFLDSF